MRRDAAALFPLVVEMAEGELRFVRISDWPELKKQTPTPRWQPSQATGEVRSDWAVDRWRVIEEAGQSQVVEVSHHDNDFSLLGRYRVKDDDPVPLRLGFSGPGQAMRLLVKLFSGSLAVALGICFFGRRWQRRLSASKPGVHAI